MSKNYGMLASSVDPSKLAATVQGAIIFCASAIILIAGHYGLSISQTDVQDFAGQIGLIIGAGYAFYGMIRKLIVWVADKLANRGTAIQG